MSKKKLVALSRIEASTYGYSSALVVDQMVFAGQAPMDHQTGEIRGNTIEEQTQLTLDNIRALLEAAGCSMNDVVKCTVYLSDMANFDRFSEVYRKYFDEPRPTRIAVQTGLWHNTLVEIDVIAIKGASG